VIVDSSAIVAIVLREPGWEALVVKLGAATTCGVGAPTLAEAGGVLSRLLQEAGLTVVPFTEDHWPIAVDAYARFGKGRHAAGLNFGDCLTYAVARLAERPLLFLGGDFAKTDLPAA
jgi:ribonuclease VapC